MVTWWRKIEGRVSPRLRMPLTTGDNAFCLTGAGVLSSMPGLVVLWYNLLVWVVFLSFISSVRCRLFVCSGLVVLCHFCLVGFLSWFFGFLLCLPLLRRLFFSPGAFASDSLPPFYRSLLMAWRVCKGSLRVSTLGTGSEIEFCPVQSMTTESAYLFLLSENAFTPHCGAKFSPLFGSL